ncbi:UDP-2,4-diacetamido-2,4,6-trideoxy-beta-L-altropyranose hydrolase [Pseudomonas panipatensis]|nr:UDP-2,4-diacetamido-2,4,6-trideoxy-beta-L-altropyranose hydrolase [Pseudomonas panipatensis]
MSSTFAFRVDASLRMGSGHLMRCLTLADALRAAGAACHFITREHPGHLIAHISQRGHRLSVLPGADDNVGEASAGPAHAAWLGATWAEDARQTAEALGAAGTDWLVVDHYAIERRWEQRLAGHCRHLMVIDDLADRAHVCDLLLDQNLGRRPEDYQSLVPSDCKRLIGPGFALLRPEFATWRLRSLADREQRPLRNLLISMGGMDRPNATGMILGSLHPLMRQHDRIQVVMGSTAPWLESVQAQAGEMPCPTEVLVDTPAMAKLMAGCDLAIGAAGSTSWERCCLGVPSVMVILADNQRAVAEHLRNAGAALLIESPQQIASALPACLDQLRAPGSLKQMARAAAAITDGQGTGRVLQALIRLTENPHAQPETT